MSATTVSTMKSSSHVKTPSHSSHSHSHSRSSRPSTTPRAYPAASVGQQMPPVLSPSSKSSRPQNDVRSPSPGYFGFVVGDQTIQPDSNPGPHVTNNMARSVAPTPRMTSVESNPEYEAFRRKSEQQRFTLNRNVSGLARQGSSSASTPISPNTRTASYSKQGKGSEEKHQSDNPFEKSFFEIPRQNSPEPLTPRKNATDHQDARLSLPASELAPKLSQYRSAQRSDTLPPTSDTGNSGPSSMAPVELIVNLLNKQSENVLVLDLRVYQQYAQSRIEGALNLCIPTTLLKRPAFTVQRLAETFSSDRDREVFDTWKDAKYIVVYDANSTQAKEAITPFNVLKKFVTEGWKGSGLVIKGGFLAVSRQEPDLVDDGPATSGQGSSTQPLSIAAPSLATLPVAGGCSMPTAKAAPANPFFNTIRQNMDLLDGVGQVPIKRPTQMSERSERGLPTWLRDASGAKDEGKMVSDRFLAIEKSEQKRMQEALSVQVQYGTPSVEKPKPIQVAGIEKGNKNRYNNIFPYDHSRVRLQDVTAGGCDYVNASFVKAAYSNRQYIATQAPIPGTFNDFWRVVWEQDVRVIVMLTAESEGGQVKSHPYWNQGEYGPLKLKKLSEKEVQLQPKKSDPSSSAPRRPSMGQRRSTHAAGEKVAGDVKSPKDETPVVTVRHLSLSHSLHPFQPMRDIAQIQYSQWPDFGAPASPTALLSLVELVNKYVRGSSSPVIGSDEAAPEGQRPIVVHCSAGCGRTGTFCTIDSVIDMLKRQRSEREDDDMDVDYEDNWVERDDTDLVAKTVEDFRHQRLSMVQNLRQFVLCYESVLQWVVIQQQKEQKRPDHSRRMSSQG